MYSGLLFTITICGADIGPKERHVRVTNDLGGGLTLTVHCKSKFLVSKCSPLLISPSNTLFFCSFEWPGTSHYFDDVYIDRRDGPNCSKCFYKIRPNGPCRFNFDTSQYDICFKWNPN
ncbi:hypothetical protein GBA52_020781 [Prunus armeniaca]|nr:hypothetical protein GBA52_020781 [Prunus armeniaca]